MPYRERLQPWVLVRLLPKMQNIRVARFRSRSDAEGHLLAYRRLMPNDQFIVIFDPVLPIEHQLKTH
ncbi:MAG: hypothetical protein F6K36_00025 [Symploca sp. SIO3C6]|uniref:Uncharacterized protein n=1 Tax=Symploca sp. SIO1C4 TaxID=2607765 RepID=A0A6B3N411_9CYAN|nr:hypothetical protein [Symploca sp. SIO3C6]NER28436.1 hypothetical protein [Symploca sp. SIO1C4]NET05933.1 hypothetical protein [Symploca sp. SIO2B6]